MALQDIISAIAEEVDAKIAAAQSAMKERIAAAKAHYTEEQKKKKEQLAQQVETKKKQLAAKALSHAEMERKNAELTLKQELLDTVYADVLSQMSRLPEAKVEQLIRTCLDTLKGSGEVRPAPNHDSIVRKIGTNDGIRIGSTIDAAGGFIFVSDTQEQDFTFEHLVDQLRTRTELDTSAKLFS